MITGPMGILCRDQDDLNTARCVMDQDEYQVKRFVGTGITRVIDIGAGIGDFALQAWNLLKVPVYAYEPCGESFNLLRRNVLSPLRTVHCFHLAIGDCEGTLTMHKRPDNQGGNYVPFLCTIDHFKAPEELQEQVECVHAKKLPLIPGTFLKIDTEGAEESILASILETGPDFVARIQVISLEWHGGISSLNRIRDLIKEMGFLNVQFSGQGWNGPLLAWR